MAKQGEELRKFVAPEFVYGFGARSMAAQYAVNMGLKRPLLVTDAGVTDAGWADDVRRTLEQAGLEVVVFDRVTPNPRGYEVEAGVAVYREETCDGIVTVGGGSPIDCAKGIGITATNGGSILEYEGIDEVSTPIPPLICIPTTAGTGADLSQFAIIGDTRRKTKIAIVSKAVVPDVALVDPETTFTMDRELTANTGMDALTHALEALVSNASSDITSLHALEACKLVFQHLRTAAKEPEDRTAREGMMRASLHAGLAFSNASLGVVHALAHSLGGWKDCAHGECNAILLPIVMRYNRNAGLEEYAEAARRIPSIQADDTSTEAADALIAAVEQLQRDLGVNVPLRNLGLTKEDLPTLVGLAFADVCVVTNPRQPTRKDLENLYAQAL